MSLPPSIAALPARTTELGGLLERWTAINSGSGHAAGLARMCSTLRAEFARVFPAAVITDIPADAPGFNPATATWFSHATVVAATANADGNYAFPVRGIRVNLTAGTGSVVATLLQAGI